MEKIEDKIIEKKESSWAPFYLLISSIVIPLILTLIPNSNKWGIGFLIIIAWVTILPVCSILCIIHGIKMIKEGNKIGGIINLLLGSLFVIYALFLILNLGSLE